MATHNKVGDWGEQIACEKLIREGYAIVARNWRMRHYEIDIIASKGNRIIFVEVKTRTSADIDPVDAVDTKKIHHLVSSANVYIHTYNTVLDPQFDIIAVTGNAEGFTVDHLRDVIIPPLKTYR